MFRKRAWLALATTAAASFAAVSATASQAQQDAGSPPVADVTVGCAQRNQSRLPREVLATASDVRIGPIAFSRLAEYARRGTNLMKNGDAYVLKTPLVVATGKTVTVAVAPGAANAALSYRRGAFPRSTAGGDRAVTFVACARGYHANSIGVATEFGGGFVASRRGCVPLEVWVDGASKPLLRRVPVGVRRC